MLSHVAADTQCYEVIGRIISLLASFDLVTGTRLATASKISFRRNSERASTPNCQRPQNVKSRDCRKQDLHFLRRFGLVQTLPAGTE